MLFRSDVARDGGDDSEHLRDVQQSDGVSHERSVERSNLRVDDADADEIDERVAGGPTRADETRPGRVFTLDGFRTNSTPARRRVDQHTYSGRVSIAPPLAPRPMTERGSLTNSGWSRSGWSRSIDVDPVGAL